MASKPANTRVCQPVVLARVHFDLRFELVDDEVDLKRRDALVQVALEAAVSIGRCGRDHFRDQRGIEKVDGALIKLRFAADDAQVRIEITRLGLTLMRMALV